MPMAPPVSPRDGAADFLILPVMTAVAMKVFLDELARRHDGQYILMIYDGAPCHSPGALNIPDTMTVRTLPSHTLRNSTRSKTYGTTCARSSSPTSSSNPWMPSKTKSPKPASTTRRTKTRKLSDPSPLSHGLFLIIYRWRIGIRLLKTGLDSAIANLPPVCRGSMLAGRGIACESV